MNPGNPILRAAAIGLALAGCAPEFDQPSDIEALRIMAVQKDHPYARPGQSVTLTMLDHDGSAAEGRTLQRFWLGGCENPIGDAYYGCFPQFAEKISALDGDLSKLDQVGLFFRGPTPERDGSRFTVRISDDIISSRPPPLDPGMPRYGIAYVFFAICAGNFSFEVPEDELQFPFKCLSQEDGRPLGQDDFVVGYSSIYAYDSLTNDNPRMLGFEAGGITARPERVCKGVDCIEADAPPPIITDAGAAEGGADAGAADGGSDAGTGAGVEPSGPPPPNCEFSDPLCVPVCTEEEQADCPPIDIRAVADERSHDEDVVLATAGTRDVGEQMWLNYYVSGGGTVTPQVKLLSDANEGWNDDHGTELRAPATPGPFFVWGVAHDNRGGVEWVRAWFRAREP